jgi:triosephosphate isomerase (TIM)
MIMKIVIANWKMYLSYKQAEQFLAANQHALATLAKHTRLIICPSTDALSSASALLKKSGTFLGAQECSAFNPGPYTGQIAALSLKELGCSHAIVGHSEQRRYLGQTENLIAQSIMHLLAQGITPIICIGETAQEYDQNRAAQVITLHLEPLLKAIASAPSSHKKIILAYEPQWAIGAQATAPRDHLQKQVDLIRQVAQDHLPSYTNTVVYGGGVSYAAMESLNGIAGLDGVMVGHESTDFQKLEKIVLSYS